MKKNYLYFLVGIVIFGVLGGNSANAFEERGRLENRFAVGNRHHDNYIDIRKARHITRLFYRAFLFREGDAEGIELHASNIANGGYGSLLQTAREFALSPEYSQGVQYAHRPRAVLENIYRVLFRRPVDPVGLQGWLPLLQNQRDADVFQGIVESDEFRRLYLY